jgi:hypothetical protein
VQLVSQGGQTYVFTAAAQKANLSGTANPVPVTLTIGANTGTVSTIAEINNGGALK